MTRTFETKLDFAKYLAVEAGNLARDLYQDKGEDFISSKGLQDFVTVADRKVEDLIRALIAQYYPDDAMLGEERGFSGDSDCIWVVDPIDGTANYMRGLPDWAVSVAYCQKNEIELGVIYAPNRNELCWAHRGGGAFCNDKVLHVSQCDQADQALMLLGRSSRHPLSEYLGVVQRTIDAKMEYRRYGSAAVSLMAVAQGRAEGYYEKHLNAWDAFAGILIIREAGGIVRCRAVEYTIDQGSEVLAIVSGLEDYIASKRIFQYRTTTDLHR